MSRERALSVEPTALGAILALRDDYRRAMACQVVHDSWHARGFTTPYLLRVDDDVVGYGAVGGPPDAPRDTVKEFYLTRMHHTMALPFMRLLIVETRARFIEAQTNDALLSLLMWDCAVDLTSETILFADAPQTSLPPPDVRLRRVTSADHDRVFPHESEPVGEWALEHAGEFVATGGYLLHYNPPYADIHMEVAAAFRRRGYGSFLVQELKRLAREAGHVPAARCHRDNIASRHALQRGGLLPCARIVRGRISP